MRVIIKDPEVRRKLGMSNSKFKNKRVSCLSKHTHDSKWEADYCNILLAKKQYKQIIGYNVHIPFSLQAGILHVVDFYVLTNDAKYEVHDTKGFKTAEWKLKKKLFEDRYPDILYRVVSRET